MPLSYRRLLWGGLAAFVLGDLVYSFFQYYQQPLDGDVAWNLVPAREVEPILRDVFGLQTWRDGLTYPNPNRFFCHWLFREYLLGAPRLLRNFTDPVSSVYLSAAVAKLGVHLALLGLMARVIVGHWRWRSLSFLAVAALLTPFFQGNGYRSYLGIIDPSVTYTFFYALPAAALLLFLLPFLDWLWRGERWTFSMPRLLTWLALAVVVCLSGPLNPGVILVLTAVGGTWWVTSRRGTNPPKIPTGYTLLWGWAAALAVYSLYVGSYNSLTIDNQLPLAEIYGRLPEGGFRLLTDKLAWPLLLLGVGLQALLLRAYRTGPRMVGWIVFFCVLYLVLLPLGGYREYRPFTLRYDTILPVTLAVLMCYGAGALELFRRLPPGRLRDYAVLPVVVGLIFTLADRPEVAAGQCEREALEVLSVSEADTVALPPDCPVLSWQPFSDPAFSKQNVRLLRMWGIIDRPLRYHNRE